MFGHAPSMCAEHRLRGVDLALRSEVPRVTRQTNGKLALNISNGNPCIVDHVVFGVGVAPDNCFAATAGLAAADGIIVDDHCRTTGPDIFAAGDRTRLSGSAEPVRLENWRHALDQGRVAGRNAAGPIDSYDVLPSFWSEQYDLYIQSVGWYDAHLPRLSKPPES